ncbi:hypothetical protein NA78x_002874 [Anatilimnocola sp. NA78]|uniref:hypothetical protein n=1 Tax=Anatilimnocola sp. NA78 TaxID=3415683 RepID=UPI003CE5AC04
MFRLLLLITMIYQVLGCPYACMAGPPSTADGSSAVGCRCCQHERCSEEGLPAKDQDQSDTACFCNSPVISAAAIQVDQDIFSSQIWTIVELPPQRGVVCASTVLDEHWSPGNVSGRDLRLAVQSLLL